MMKRLRAALPLIFAAGLAHTSRAAVEFPISLKSDIVYKTTPEGDLRLDLYYPDKKVSGKYPVVVYTHGGGWAAGNKKSAKVGDKAKVIRDLTEKGFCVAAVDYRLCKKGGNITIKDCVTDSKDAIRYLARNSDELSVDTSRVFTFGDSAGGQIAQMLLLTPPGFLPGDPDLAGATYKTIAGVSWYGPCDFEKTELFNPDGRANFKDRFGARILKPGTAPKDTLRLYREVSPVNYLKRDGPPLLMIQGDKDTTIPVQHARYMKERAEAVHAPVEIIIVENSGHNWRSVGGDLKPPRGEIVRRTVAFLQHHRDQLSKK